MSTEVFKPRKFRAVTLRMIERINAIIEEYQAQGFRLSLRQLHYQFVARDHYANTHANYRLLQRTLHDARMAGDADWDAIEDRSRDTVTYSSWDSPAAILKSAASSYREDLWRDQDYRPEVWIEKDALTGVIGPVCDEYRVPYSSTRGNTSTTFVHETGARIAGHIEAGYTPVVIHLADHDPSGVHMTRDLERRLSIHARDEIEVRRVALNMDQVQRYRPPPNFVKENDRSAGGYRARFGTDECWELDALAPDVIADLIRREIESLIDRRKLAKAKKREDKGRAELAALAREWGTR